MADKINAAGYETKPWWPYVRELMEGGGSVTVEQLNVTENGTYTAEAGKAYSPVVVNVEGDLTIATVTTTVNDEFTLELEMISISSDGENEELTTIATFANDLETKLVLYKGAAGCQFTDADLGDYTLVSASGSGGVSITHETDPVLQVTVWTLLVTGNGSLTLTMDWKN